MKIIDLTTVIIDQSTVYHGLITHLTPAKREGGNPMGFIKPESEFVQDLAYSIRVTKGKAKKNPGNVCFVPKRSEKDSFFACEGNDYPLTIGQRVSFNIRYDSLGYLQAFNVKAIQGVPRIESDAKEDPALAVYYGRKKAETQAALAAKALSAALGAYASEMPEEDDFEESDFPSDEEIDEDEAEFAVYYDDEE